MLENFFCQWGVFECAFLEACMQFIVIGKELNVNNSKKIQTLHKCKHEIISCEEL
jgi:hypothetical protein